MPDEWETENGLNKDDPEDRNGDRNNDGYTNLEEYLYSLVPIHVNVAPVVNLLSPVTDTGYLDKDTVFVKAVAFDYGAGSIESFEIFLGEDLVISSDSNAIDTILTGLNTGLHYLVAKVTDDSGSIAFDTSKFYIGTALYSLDIDSIIGDGSVTLYPPGGVYVEGMPVSLLATPEFPFYFEEWSGDSTSGENPLLLTMNKDVVLTANFNVDSTAVLKVNFQPESSAIPEGYFPDFGYQYGARGNGQTYGWLGGDNIETRERSHEDLRKATLNHFQKSGDDVWEIQIENGIYSVYLHMGDAGYTDQTNSLYVEGIQLLDETSGTNFDEFYLTGVPVGDGNLTLTPIGPGAKINYIEISTQPANYLIVNRGSGGGAFDPGTIVNITADEPQAQYVFEGWTGDVSHLADSTSSSTSLTMPEGVVTVTAVYRSTVGIDDKSAQQKSFNCYPNPAGSSFTIDLSEIGESEIEIYNLLGSKVYHTESAEKITSVDDHNLKSGIYLIRVTDRNRNIYQQRIIIQ